MRMIHAMVFSRPLATMMMLLLTLSACSSRPTESRNGNGSEESTMPQIDRSKSDVPYDGPEVTLAFLQQPMHPPRNFVIVNVTAPSGGWRFMLDKGEIVNGIAQLFLTLEQPAPGEATTRALVEHQASFATTESFTGAEVYINLIHRGVGQLVEYRLAKKQSVDDVSEPPPPVSETAAPGAAAGQSGGTMSDEPYTYPPVKLQVAQSKRMPPISHAIIEIEVPTGGWTLNLDHGTLEGDTASIYLTLEKPGDDELVTQALVKLRAEYTSEAPPFTKAVVYIHQARRDIQTLTTNYRLAAKSR